MLTMFESVAIIILQQQHKTSKNFLHRTYKRNNSKLMRTVIKNMARKTRASYVTEKDIFPVRLSGVMKERKETQSSLAQKTGVQRQTISLYMLGQSKPDVDRLTAIAKALCVSADYLLGIVDEETTDADIQSVCNYTGLSSDTVKELHSYSRNSIQLSFLRRFFDQLLSERRICDRILQDIQNCITAEIAANAVVDDNEQDDTQFLNKGLYVISAKKAAGLFFGNALNVIEDAAALVLHDMCEDVIYDMNHGKKVEIGGYKWETYDND